MAPQYVSGSDPALGICQSSTVQNLNVLRDAIDNANDTNPYADFGSSGPQALSATQQSQLAAEAKMLSADSQHIPGHGALSSALYGAAQIFTQASGAGGGLVTDAVAQDANKYTAAIQAQCGSFAVGGTPAAAKPGPGIWNWALFWDVLGGYTVMAITASILLARVERLRPREQRSASRVLALSLVWWASLLLAGGRYWRRFVNRQMLTADERARDRRNAVTAETVALEAVLKAENRRIRDLRKP